MDPNIILKALGLKGAYGIGKQLKSGVKGISKAIGDYNKMKTAADQYRNARDILYSPDVSEDDKLNLINKMGAGSKYTGEAGMKALQKLGINPKNIKTGKTGPVTYTAEQAKMQQALPKGKYPGTKPVLDAYHRQNKAQSIDFGKKIADEKARQDRLSDLNKPKFGPMTQSQGKIVSKLGLTPKDIGFKAAQPKAVKAPKAPKAPKTPSIAKPSGPKPSGFDKI